MIAGRRADPAPDFAAVAAVTQRLAVLLDSGIPPVSAWRHAADGMASASPIVEAVIEAAGRGGVGRELAEHLIGARGLAPPAERAAWGALAAAWSVAVDSGSPLGPALQRFAGSLRGVAQALRDVEVALAGPVATSRVVLVLPAIGLLLGVVLGFDAPRILLTTPPGWICAAVGAVLVFVGVRWNRRLIAAARVSAPTPGLALELLAIAVSGGASLERARERVAEALAEAELPPLGADADVTLAFCASAGVPAAGLLLEEAEELRRGSRAAAQLRAATLGTRLLLPLGVCILPAFVVLGVAPIAMSILSSTVGQF